MKITTKLLLPITALLLQACGGGPDTSRLNREPAAAPALPESEVANVAPGGPTSESEAFRLLEQATFGPQSDAITRTAEIGPDRWINVQVGMNATFMLPALYSSRQDRWNEYVNIWWRHSVKADDQLRQRVAFALSQIFVVSAADGLSQQQPGLANYYDILIKHSFGNYRDLIEEITLNPIMGEYLSMKGNRKPNPEKNIRPDENYARELLQLFSIGTEMLNEDGSPILDSSGVPVPSYTQDDIEAFAHVFTGWHFANAEDFRWPKNKDYINPMAVWPEYHDTGEKKLLRGRVLPAGQTAEQDLTAALDNVFNHPNVGPFISKQLIQRLVTSNPSTQYVKDVAAVFNRNAAGVRGSLGSTIKAILMHKEARLGHLDYPNTFGKLKEPVLRVAQVWRAFEPRYIHENFNYAWAQNEIGQAPLNAPTVFNFFRPDYSQPGAIEDQGLVSPEFGIVDESSIIKITSRMLANTLWSHNYKADSDSNRIAIDIEREMQLEPDRDALINHLDMLLLGGTMSSDLRAEINALMDERDYEDGASQRVVEAIFLIVTSPEAAVQI